MMSAGLTTNESGTTVPILEDAVPFIKLAPIFAEAGMITVTGSNLVGSGVLEAPGNISIGITNNSPAFLSVNSITIPQSSGGILFYDGKTVTTNAQIAAINTGFIPPEFSRIQTSNTSSDPSVTINNTYNASDPANAGNTFVNPNIDLDGDISALPTVLATKNSCEPAGDRKHRRGNREVARVHGFHPELYARYRHLSRRPLDHLVERHCLDRGRGPEWSRLGDLAFRGSRCKWKRRGAGGDRPYAGAIRN